MAKTNVKDLPSIEDLSLSQQRGITGARSVKRYVKNKSFSLNSWCGTCRTPWKPSLPPPPLAPIYGDM